MNQTILLARENASEVLHSPNLYIQIQELDERVAFQRSLSTLCQLYLLTTTTVRLLHFSVGDAEILANSV